MIMANTKFVYNYDKGLLYDVFSILGASMVSRNLDDSFSVYGYTVDERIASSYRRISAYITNHSRGSRVFFFPQLNGANLFAEVFKQDLLDSQTMDELLARIEQKSPAQIAYDTLSFYDANNDFDTSFYASLVQSDSLMLTDFLNGIHLPAEHKWELVSLLKSPESSVAALLSLIREVFNELLVEYEFLKPLRLEWAESVESKWKADDIRSLFSVDDSVSDIMKQENFQEVQVMSTLFNPFAVDIVHDGREANIFFGYQCDVLPVPEGEGDLETYTSVFKAFTDPTRTQIIDMLHGKECYNGEISRNLAVPMSSLTHHLEIITEAGFVDRRVEGKRTYYKLNKKQFNFAAQLLKRYSEQ